MFDFGMALGLGKDLSAAITSDAYDFGQASPASGAYADPIVVVIRPKGATTGADTSNAVTVKIQDSADNSDYADVLTTPTIPGADLAGGLVIPMPIRHRRYVKVVTEVTGTVTGTVDIYMSNSYPLALDVKKQGIDVVQTAD